MTPHECFQTFISSIFYVGKGKRSRPYSHLYEALEYFKGEKSSKVQYSREASYLSTVWSNREAEGSHYQGMVLWYGPGNSMGFFSWCISEALLEGAAHPAGVELLPRCHLTALLPERYSCGGVHTGGLHGGCHWY